MKNLSRTFITIFLGLLMVSSENPHVKLSGKIVSSESKTSPYINNAFDGNISTNFKSDEASNGWIGLKLDSKYLITRIGLAFPKDSKKEDYLLSVIEGSNEPTFYDSDIIYMITQELKLGEMNYLELKGNKRYKYIRYIGPESKYCVISELEIYGDDELDTTNENKLKNENEGKRKKDFRNFKNFFFRDDE